MNGHDRHPDIPKPPPPRENPVGSAAEHRSHKVSLAASCLIGFILLVVINAAFTVLIYLVWNAVVIWRPINHLEAWLMFVAGASVIGTRWYMKRRK